MKIIPPSCPEPETGPKYWRSLDQLADRPEFRRWLDQEFPAGASIAPEGESRREWMKLMSASFLLAGLGGFATGCRRPEEELRPFARQPEGYVHGVPQHFATAMPTRGTAIPLVVKSSDGRPTKIEGNPSHPDSNGGTDAFAQAALLELYDPDRAHRHLREGADVRSEVVADFLAETGRRFETAGGKGLFVLAERSSSPSRARLQEAFAEKFPQARWCVYEAVDPGLQQGALSQLFGRSVRPHYHLEKAHRILSLDCDFIGSESESYRLIRGYAKGRRGADDSMNRLYAVESLMTLTGGNADHRLRVRPTDVVRVAARIAVEVLQVTGVASGSIAALRELAQGAPVKDEWVAACARDLVEHKGASVVLPGVHQPAAVHLIAHALNAALGAFESVVSALPEPELPGGIRIDELTAALNGGSVDTLVILGGNPVYNAPADLDFASAVKKAGSVVRLGYYEDETAEVATWHLAAAHFLESWGDARTGDGTVVPVQPLILPIFGGLTELEVLGRLLGLPKPQPFDIVRATFTGDDAAWQRFLHDGFAEGSAAEPVAASEADLGRLAPALAALPAPAAASGLDVILFRDASVDDGRHANNGWLQEMPDPITKITWENVVLVSPETAKELGVTNAAYAKDGQYHQPVIRVAVGGRFVEGPVWIQPGLADGTIAMALGYGRKHVGRVGTGCGFDAYPLFTAAGRHIATGAKAEQVFRKVLVAVTQEHGLMEGRPVIREANLDQFKEKPDFAQNMDLDAHLPHYVPQKTAPDGRNGQRYQNIYEHPYDQNPETQSRVHQWGMVVDLQSCVGCSACVVACQSENNIPIVGKDQVARGREMHWIRIDRYYSTATDADLGELKRKPAAEDPQMAVQPMFCQHCESAPCESVCPVNATVHDEEGLNVMAYNRCIGTRYCANNCPYKVRRFNFFDYNKRETDYGKAQSQHFFNFGNLYKGPLGEDRNAAPEWEIIKLVKNPDVSVRMRGVMEKCTFCVQRLEQAKISQKAKAGNSADVQVKDGAVKTACQQACPAEAITFGNILDPDSAVSVAKRNPRNYSVLGFLDTRPRVTYLARIRNPHPDIARLEGRSGPDSLRDYERYRHENPLEESGHGTGHEEKHAARAVEKGAA